MFWNFQNNWYARSLTNTEKLSKTMLNSYQPNDKSPASVQPVYVATCITHGFFQDSCRTIGDAIFVHIVTSRVYNTSMIWSHTSSYMYIHYRLSHSLHKTYWLCDTVYFNYMYSSSWLFLVKFEPNIIYLIAFHCTKYVTVCFAMRL